jgi:phosphoglycerate dehydrogenase-like enzyme
MVRIISTFNLKEDLMSSLHARFGDRIVITVVKDFGKAGDEIGLADVLLYNKLDLEGIDFERMKNLKWVQVVFSGINHMPLEYFEKRGIILTNARGVHRIQMSEYALGLLLMIVRRFPHYIRSKDARKWDPIKTDELYGKTIGFIGTGAVAKEIARKLRPFDVRIIGVKNRVEPVEHFDEVYGIDKMDMVLEQSDIVIVLVPLTDQTYRMIGEQQFRKMKRTAWFVNIARGPVVDQEAMIKALKEGWIAGAGLDVYDEEPLPADSPLWELDNVIMTPHIAGPSPHYMERFLEIFAVNLQAFISGKTDQMINVIDYARKY